MKTTVNSGSLEIMQAWIETKCRGRYASTVAHINIQDGRIDLIFRDWNGAYFYINMIDMDDETRVRTSYIHKRKYYELKNNK